MRIELQSPISGILVHEYVVWTQLPTCRCAGDCRIVGGLSLLIGGCVEIRRKAILPEENGRSLSDLHRSPKTRQTCRNARYATGWTTAITDCSAAISSVSFAWKISVNRRNRPAIHACIQSARRTTTRSGDRLIANAAITGCPAHMAASAKTVGLNPTSLRRKLRVQKSGKMRSVIPNDAGCEQ